MSVPSAPRTNEPLVMADVVRELQAIADAAERLDRHSILEARRRAQSLLDRLRAQFMFEVVGPGSPAPVAAVTAEVATPLETEDAA